MGFWAFRVQGFRGAFGRFGFWGCGLRRDFEVVRFRAFGLGLGGSVEQGFRASDGGLGKWQKVNPQSRLENGGLLLGGGRGSRCSWNGGGQAFLPASERTERVEGRGGRGRGGEEERQSNAGFIELIFVLQRSAGSNTPCHKTNGPSPCIAVVPKPGGSS